MIKMIASKTDEREIVISLEVTGFNSETDKIVEIALVELMDAKPTGRTLHHYINPECEVPEEFVKIHGLTTDFLKDKPKFKDVAKEIWNFIGGDCLIWHHAAFSLPFFENELEASGIKMPLVLHGADIMDMAEDISVDLPKYGLNALCEYYGINMSPGKIQGALLDATLIAEVYEKIKANGAYLDVLFDMAYKVEGEPVADLSIPICARIDPKTEEYLRIIAKNLSSAGRRESIINVLSRHKNDIAKAALVAISKDTGLLKKLSESDNEIIREEAAKKLKNIDANVEKAMWMEMVKDCDEETKQRFLQAMELSIAVYGKVGIKV